MVVNNNPDLTNNYASLETFRATRPQPRQVNTINTEQAPDRVEISNETQPQKEAPAEKPKKKKRGIIQSFKNMIAGIKKFCIGVAEYSVATAKGLVYGTIAAAGVLGIDAGIGIANIINEKAGKNAKNGLETTAESMPAGAKKAAKIISKKGVFGAIGAAATVMGYHWFKASLNVSQRGAAVDHRWGSGHDEVER